MGSGSHVNFLVSWRSNKNPFRFKPCCSNVPKAHKSTSLPCLVLCSVLHVADSFMTVELERPHCPISAHQSSFRSTGDAEGVGYMGEWKPTEPSRRLLCAICSFLQKPGIAYNRDKLRVLGGQVLAGFQIICLIV